LGGIVRDESILVGAKGSGVNERKVRKIQEVIDGLGGPSGDVNRRHPNLVKGGIVPFRDF
jgi:hypothetical protein